MADHVLADAGLADVDAELPELAVNMRRSPERIFTTEHTDQLANLFWHRWAAALAMGSKARLTWATAIFRGCPTSLG